MAPRLAMRLPALKALSHPLPINILCPLSVDSGFLLWMVRDTWYSAEEKPRGLRSRQEPISSPFPYLMMRHLR